MSAEDHPAVVAAFDAQYAAPAGQPDLPYIVEAVLRWAASEVSGWDPTAWLYEQADDLAQRSAEGAHINEEQT